MFSKQNPDPWKPEKMPFRDAHWINLFETFLTGMVKSNRPMTYLGPPAVNIEDAWIESAIYLADKAIAVVDARYPQSANAEKTQPTNEG